MKQQYPESSQEAGSEFHHDDICQRVQSKEVYDQKDKIDDRVRKELCIVDIGKIPAADEHAGDREDSSRKDDEIILDFDPVPIAVKKSTYDGCNDHDDNAEFLILFFQSHVYDGCKENCQGRKSHYYYVKHIRTSDFHTSFV